MSHTLLRIYNRLVIRRPVVTLLIIALLLGLLGWHAVDFRLDASADSLVLENDPGLRLYRELRQVYGSDDALIISYTPEAEIFTSETLDRLRRLRDDLAQLDRVASVTSILDVPLLDSPRITYSDLENDVRTLDTPGVDLQLARREFLTSPLYRDLILSADGRTTALQLNLAPDTRYQQLLTQRNTLRQKKQLGPLTSAEELELQQVSAEFKIYSAKAIDREAGDIAEIRSIMDRHRTGTDLHLGGVSMIVSDMIDFIRHDLMIFGIGVLLFLIGTLATIFRQPRWVFLPMLCCAAAVLFMFGILGLFDWRVTVVSSNFTSLLLIITLSLTIHLIVRYHELQLGNPSASQTTLVLEMVRSKALPCLYTALTTIVAFVSLLVSGIRPVIDFGWMMAIGICAAFILSFVLFPAALVLLPPRSFTPRLDLTGALTRGCATWITRHGRLTLVLFALIGVFSAIGIMQLTVENRFIDNFKSDTEIYQGMALIDRQLGGTTPLDVVINADPDFRAQAAIDTEDDWEEDDPFAEVGADAGLTASSYWYNIQQFDLLKGIHRYLEELPESGKVISLATSIEMMRQLNGDQVPDNLMLAIIHKKLPPDIEATLFDPYMTKDGNQVRFALRVIDSDPRLKRSALLKKISTDLQTQFDIKPEQLQLSGMFVLYNNVLQSLYRSQILTLGVVFLAIMAMFVVLFRSLRLAIIAIIPNLVAAGLVLGLMGWLRIPLDIMTITIAAITIGIAVDDTIHYVHRFSEEVARDLDYPAAVRRCHASVGRAMYYTSITVIVGFGILGFSNFVPTIYFGLFTGLAMAVAMIANLTLLALLLMMLKPHQICWLPGTGAKDKKGSLR